MHSSLSRPELVPRRINDAIERGFWPGEEASLVRVRCECGRFDCSAFVRIRVADYGRIRATAGCFVVLTGHETRRTETVVERQGDYAVVEKRRFGLRAPS